MSPLFMLRPKGGGVAQWGWQGRWSGTARIATPWVGLPGHPGQRLDRLDRCTQENRPTAARWYPLNHQRCPAPPCRPRTNDGCAVLQRSAHHLGHVHLFGLVVAAIAAALHRLVQHWGEGVERAGGAGQGSARAARAAWCRLPCATASPLHQLVPGANTPQTPPPPQSCKQSTPTVTAPPQPSIRPHSPLHPTPHPAAHPCIRAGWRP